MYNVISNSIPNGAFFSRFNIFKGAMVFQDLEQQNEMRNYEAKMAVANSINDTMHYVSQMLWFLASSENATDKDNYTATVSECLH